MNKRNYNELSKTDKKMNLLAGDPFYLNNIKIQPLKLSEIKNITYTKYASYINLLTVDVRNLLDMNKIEDEKIIDDIKKNKFTIFDVVTGTNKETEKQFKKALSIFLNESNIYIDRKNLCIFLGKLEDKENVKILTREDFKILQEILRLQNFLKDYEREYRPANKKAEELIEKKKEVEKKIREKNKDKSLDLGDIVDIVCCYGDDVNYINIWGLTIFQIYNSYTRILIKDKYDKEFLIALNSTEEGRKKLDLEHWGKGMEI